MVSIPTFFPTHFFHTNFFPTNLFPTNYWLHQLSSNEHFQIQLFHTEIFFIYKYMTILPNYLCPNSSSNTTIPPFPPFPLFPFSPFPLFPFSPFLPFLKYYISPTLSFEISCRTNFVNEVFKIKEFDRTNWTHFTASPTTITRPTPLPHQTPTPPFFYFFFIFIFFTPNNLSIQQFFSYQNFLFINYKDFCNYSCPSSPDRNPIQHEES